MLRNSLGRKPRFSARVTGVQLELGSISLSLHMNVPGFCAVIRPEKEAIRADDKRCWHGELALILQHTFANAQRVYPRKRVSC